MFLTQKTCKARPCRQKKQIEFSNPNEMKPHHSFPNKIKFSVTKISFGLLYLKLFFLKIPNITQKNAYDHRCEIALIQSQ